LHTLVNSELYKGLFTRRRGVLRTSPKFYIYLDPPTPPPLSTPRRAFSDLGFQSFKIYDEKLAN